MHEFNYRRQYDYEIGEYDLMEKTFIEIARSQTRPFWEGSFNHPFILQLQDGTLPIENFRYYLIQDAYYLRHFSALYKKVAEITEEPALKTQMLENAGHLAEGELAIRANFFEELAVTDDELKGTGVAPTAYHYVSHMYRQLVENNDAIAAASLLPCSWLYFEIGQRLRQLNVTSPVPIYQRWIETYGGEEASEAIEKECALLNRLYAESSQEEKDSMVSAFVISARMEFNFWEMAFNFETWPEGIQHDDK